jgi:prevent-host-death family protein
MDSIISVQDIRTQLGVIAKRAATGESFTVIRNSKPAFRIVPLAKTEYPPASSSRMTLREVRDRFESDPVGPDELTPGDLDRIIREVHQGADRGPA